MHLYLFVRGVQHRVDLWKTLAQGQYFKWRRKNLETGEEEITLVQGALRPTVFGAYEYIFPKEALPTVLAILGKTEPESKIKNKFRISLLTKIFGCKAITKKTYNEAKEIPPSMGISESERGLGALTLDGVAIHVIGTKEDEFKEMPQWGYYQELL